VQPENVSGEQYIGVTSEDFENETMMQMFNRKMEWNGMENWVRYSSLQAISGHDLVLTLENRAVARIFCLGSDHSPLLPYPALFIPSLSFPPLLSLPSLPQIQLGHLGSAVSSSSGGRGGATTAKVI